MGALLSGLFSLLIAAWCLLDYASGAPAWNLAVGSVLAVVGVINVMFFATGSR